MKAVVFFLFFFRMIFLVVQPLHAQLVSTGFEGLSDEAAFTRNTGAASWVGQGFTVPWVNGFNDGRAQIDNAYARSGTNSLRLYYPAGQYGTANTGGQAPLMVTPAAQYYMSYWLRFADDFSWGTTSEGGKLPGLAGGGRCSGCNTCTGSNGFTARLMWRAGGRLVLYLYHLDKLNPPCGDDLRLQLTPGIDYVAPRGEWIQIIERVKVNTGTNHDGEVEIWVNEQPALLVTGIQFVSNGDQVDNLYFSTFHGGSTAAWAPVTDSYAWFDDIKISTNSSDIFTPLSLLETEKGVGRKELYNNELVLYPQPVRSGGRMEISLNELENCRLEWRDVSGRILHEEVLKEKTGYLNVPRLPKGVYYLSMVFTSEVVTKKIMVE